MARVEPLQFPDAQCEKDRESLGEDVSDLSRNQVSSSATATDAEPWDSRDGALQAPVIRTSLAANSGPYYAEIKTNILSGLTVALALVPEAIAFALVAHVKSPRHLRLLRHD